MFIVDDGGVVWEIAGTLEGVILVYLPIIVSRHFVIYYFYIKKYFTNKTIRKLY